MVANNVRPTPNDKIIKDLLLDSSLIVDTNGKIIYNIKLVQCGNYVQVYYLEKAKMTTNSIDKNSELNLKKINNSYTKKQDKENVIETKNITRSKLECQRLAKCNSTDWKTFITLTFEDNIKDIKTANVRFRHFINKIHRVEKDFKYLGIIEFQKRGAVHYHVLTNIDIDDSRFIYKQDNNPRYKHIKYWVDGFTKVDNIKGDIKKIIGYISKYMTKDIDNRLFNSHRYFYSRNLIQPSISYINSSNEKDLEYLKKAINDRLLIYENDYINNFTEEKIAFKEYL